MRGLIVVLARRVAHPRQPTEVGGRPAVERPMLGFAFFRYRDGRIGVTVAPKAPKRAQDRIRRLTTRNWGVSMERRIREINRFTVGWTAYFAFADSILAFEKLEKWLRRRLRQVRWKEWKRPQTRYRNLRRSVSPTGTPARGRPRSSGTGVSRGPGRSRPPSPTPTGRRPWA
jgi:Group II intron, maturase-specific domain